MSRRPAVESVLGGLNAREAFRVARSAVKKLGLRGQDAEDAAATAVLKAINAWDDEFVEDGLGGRERWLATIAANLARDEQRRARNHAQSQPVMDVTQQELHLAARPLKPDTSALVSEARQARRTLFDSLPPKLAAAAPVVAKQVAGELSREEAANLLGLSVPSYDKLAPKVKAAIKSAVAEGTIDIEELFDMDQAREGRA